MTAKEIIAELKKLGTEQTKKMWLKHGAQEPCLGVKVEDMGDCKIPFAPDHIKKFEARSPIGKKRKSPKC
jgi:hypothetical protein